MEATSEKPELQLESPEETTKKEHTEEEQARDPKLPRKKMTILAPRRGYGMEEVTDRDVLSGRGGCTNGHPGNYLYRRIVRANQDTYKKVSLNVKHLLTISIIEAIRRQGGRFMCRDAETNTWKELPEHQTRTKVAQALRGEPNQSNPTNRDSDVKERPEPRGRIRPKPGDKPSKKSVARKKNAGEHETMPPPPLEKPRASRQGAGFNARGVSQPPAQTSRQLSLQPTDQQMQAISEQHFYKSLLRQNINPSLSVQAGGLSGASPHILNLSTQASTHAGFQLPNDSARPADQHPPNPGDWTLRNEEGSIFFEALEGMTGVPLRKKKAPPVSPGESSETGNKESYNKADSKLMSLASLASVYEQQEEDLETKVKQDEKQRVEETSHQNSAKSVPSTLFQQQRRSNYCTPASDMQHNQLPMLPPRNVPQANSAIPPVAATLPGFIPPPAAFHMDTIRLNRLAGLKFALAQYSSLDGLPPTQQTERNNWDFPNPRLALPQDGLLFSRARPWQAKDPEENPLNSRNMVERAPSSQASTRTSSLQIQHHGLLDRGGGASTSSSNPTRDSFTAETPLQQSPPKKRKKAPTQTKDTLVFGASKKQKQGQEGMKETVTGDRIDEERRAVVTSDKKRGSEKVEGTMDDSVPDTSGLTILGAKRRSKNSHIYRDEIKKSKNVTAEQQNKNTPNRKKAPPSFKPNTKLKSAPAAKPVTSRRRDLPKSESTAKKKKKPLEADPNPMKIAKPSKPAKSKRDLRKQKSAKNKNKPRVGPSDSETETEDEGDGELVVVGH